MYYKVIDIHTHTYPEAIAPKAVVSLGNFYNFEVKCPGIYTDLEEQALKSRMTETEVVGFFDFFRRHKQKSGKKSK